MKQNIALLCFVSTAILSTTVNAEIRFNGFASVVAGKDTEDKNFRDSPYTNELSFKPESKFALQATADLGEGLSATAQIMARGENDFNAEFEWAYFSYELNDHHTIRAGRLRIPFYKYSDYLDVGYAYPWIRPPRAMYSLTFSSYDGVSLLSNFTLGQWDVSSNIIYGNVEDTFFSTTTPTDGKLESTFGFNIQLSKDWFSAYTAYITTDVFIPNSAIDSLAGLVAALDSPEKSTNLKLDGDKGTFNGLGFTIDYDNFLINSEASVIEIKDSLTLKNEQWYISLAYRVNEFTPYITYQETETKSNTTSAQLFASTPVPASVHPAQIPLNAFIQGAFNSRHFKYDVITLGVRYDFHPSAALKFEYNKMSDIVDLGSTSNLGTFENPESTGQLSVGIDLVF